jgi:ArsR family transcriptional regulator, arsenate/arsenite/antimonite-responsive transcriptional repressor
MNTGSFSKSNILISPIILRRHRMMYNRRVDTKELKKIFEVFNNEPRLAILSLLKSKGEKSVGQIADRLDISYKVVSKHLLILFDTGILQRRYDGPFVLYKISPTLPGAAKVIINGLL